MEKLQDMINKLEFGISIVEKRKNDIEEYIKELKEERDEDILIYFEDMLKETNNRIDILRDAIDGYQQILAEDFGVDVD